jgi:hypothetical protein
MNVVRRLGKTGGLGLLVLLAGVGALGVPGANARPTYFATFTSQYGITSGDRLYACGVCHYKWTGTGGRNAFGQAVEQQLYLGKSISQSLHDIEGDDTDGDGFTNVDEILTYMTLPGYSCSTFFQAEGAPLNVHTFVTPMVASCLEPLDIRVAPTSIGLLANVGDVDTAELEIFNNGSDFPLDISSYGLTAGSDPAFSLMGPAAPLTIPVGGSVVVEVAFAPQSFIFASGAVRIESNDPDEATLDVPLTAFGFIAPLAPPEDRQACLRDVDKNFRRYAKRHLREWGRCYLDEVSGVACDTARRDRKIQQEEVKLRDRVGGAKDRHCAALGVTPSLLGYPSTCGGSCDTITITTFSTYLDCLLCRQDEARDAMLDAALGTAPPDLPPNQVSGQAAACQKQLIKAVEKGVDKALKKRDRCAYENLTAVTPVDCAAALADDLATIRAKADAAILHCRSTSGLLGCLFELPSSPGCLGDAALSISADLVDAIFGAGD